MGSAQEQAAQKYQSGSLLSRGRVLPYVSRACKSDLCKEDISSRLFPSQNRGIKASTHSRRGDRTLICEVRPSILQAPCRSGTESSRLKLWRLVAYTQPLSRLSIQLSLQDRPSTECSDSLARKLGGSVCPQPKQRPRLNLIWL